MQENPQTDETTHDQELEAPQLPKLSDAEILSEWLQVEIAWWAKLYNRDPELELVQAEPIIVELLDSGYTVRDAELCAVHERLRRHRFDLNPSVFYPDDKFASVEIRSALQRAYSRGRADQKMLDAPPPPRRMTQEEMKPFVELKKALDKIQELNAELKALNDELQKFKIDEQEIAKKWVVDERQTDETAQTV